MPEASLEMPKNLLACGHDQGPDDEGRRSFVAALPRLVAAAARRWSLQVGRPYQPGGVASWVAPATRSGGPPVVLKLALPHAEALHEAEGLRAWQGNGMVRLYDAAELDGVQAMLLERCEPGGALSAQDERTQDEIIAAVLRRAWINPGPAQPFRPLTALCEILAEPLRAVCAGRGPAAAPDPGLVAEALALLRELPRSARRSVLLCTDLHAGNVLRAGRAPWLGIDPKPYLGDPAFDTLQHMLNCHHRLISAPAALADRMAALLDLEANRVRRWLFARCASQAPSQPGLWQPVQQLASLI